MKMSRKKLVKLVTEENMDNTNFVQATIWLKSATIFMENVSVEQFDFIFDKQWRKDSSVKKIQCEHCEISEIVTQCDKKNREATGSDNLSEKRHKPCAFTSFQKLDKFFSVENYERYETSNNCIIPETDKEYSSSSDMFRDSPENEKSSDLSKQASSRTDYFTVVISESDSSDIVTFNGSYPIHKQNSSPLISESNRQKSPSFTQEFNLSEKDCFSPHDSPQNDSAYDTYQLKENKDLPPEEFSADLLKIDLLRNRKPEICNRKRKLESADEFSKNKEKNSFGKEEKNSLQCLKFSVEDLNANSVAFQSVKAILLVLENEETTKKYARKRRWKNSFEEQAVNAVLNFCEVFEAESKSAVCTREIVRTITNLVDESVENRELNKETMSTHRISIILQLCTPMQVCVETINHLIAKLKFYQNTLVSLKSTTTDNIHRLTAQLYTIFYTLTLCLRKYILIREKGEKKLEEEIISPVVNLWKKQLNFEGEIAKENAKAREGRWCMVLDNFMVIAMESNFIQFVEKSRMLVDLLTSGKKT